jgi:hypothetical protein
MMSKLALHPSAINIEQYGAAASIYTARKGPRGWGMHRDTVSLATARAVVRRWGVGYKNKYRAELLVEGTTLNIRLAGLSRKYRCDNPTRAGQGLCQEFESAEALLAYIDKQIDQFVIGNTAAI